jgi:hypothetical protein
LAVEAQMMVDAELVCDTYVITNDDSASEGGE